MRAEPVYDDDAYITAALPSLSKAGIAVKSLFRNTPFEEFMKDLWSRPMKETMGSMMHERSESVSDSKASYDSPHDLDTGCGVQSTGRPQDSK